jgi:hypothetical protein
MRVTRLKDTATQSLSLPQVDRPAIINARPRNLLRYMRSSAGDVRGLSIRQSVKLEAETAYFMGRGV